MADGVLPDQGTPFAPSMPVRAVGKQPPPPPVAGWSGGLSAHHTLGFVLAAFAVQQWFRWEPRH
ncbi:hypothetical protein ABZ622_34780 [Streptomyces sp. NPDC007164]|uniref:hypothetical protein n=1 Tax=Streptomyces sp. NPDC007164 TaxID=3156918 RepID=UPI0033D09C24